MVPPYKGVVWRGWGEGDEDWQGVTCGGESSRNLGKMGKGDGCPVVEEPLWGRRVWMNAFIEQGVDAVLVIGCSGGVGILVRLLEACRRVNPGCRVINVNPGESCIPFEHVHVRMGAGEAMMELDRVLRG